MFNGYSLNWCNIKCKISTRKEEVVRMRLKVKHRLVNFKDS